MLLALLLLEFQVPIMHHTPRELVDGDLLVISKAQNINSTLPIQPSRITVKLGSTCVLSIFHIWIPDFFGQTKETTSTDAEQGTP